MRTLAERIEGTMVLRAPCSGVVRIHPPRALCGELEVYEEHEPVASMGDTTLASPAHGFLVRLLVTDDAWVEKDSAVAEFRVS